MANSFRQVSRQIHLWFALAVLIPTVIVIGSGILLQVKKQFDWIQPPTQKGQAESKYSSQPTITFEKILLVSQSIPELEVKSWDDIDRLDVRPGKRMLKVLANNHWEAQLDAHSGEVLQVAYRRSDTIEAIHDGSWFAEPAKLWLFLPAGILLMCMWVSGAILLYTSLKSKFKKRTQRAARD